MTNPWVEPRRVQTMAGPVRLFWSFLSTRDNNFAMLAKSAYVRRPGYLAAALFVALAFVALLFSGPVLAAPDLFQQLLTDYAPPPFDLHGARTQDLLKEEEEIWPDFEYFSDEEHQASIDNHAIEHVNVTSNTDIRSDGNYFPIKFGDIESYNPNIIPHPYRSNTWIIVAQRDKKDDDNSYWRTSLVCEATFVNGTLSCVKPPMNLPLASTTSEQCVGKLVYFNYYIGPHDARVFYGGDGRPYIVYGSQSEFNCLGQFIQDFRRVADWGPKSIDTNRTQPFFYPTDIQRTPPYNDIEKNYFIFWDTRGDMYVHHDIVPTRTFTKLYANGSVGPDLAPLATGDVECMEAYMPVVKKLTNMTMEWNHQSTNSLAITLCNRDDKTCQEQGNNTYLFIIFQHKSFYGHGVYEPYLMLFEQDAPFAVHAISSQPFWIPGRGRAGDGWAKNTWKPDDQSQMIFVVSMNWKEQGVGYHGYLDDELLISFGIEDQHSGGISVVVRDLMQEFSYCDSLWE